MNMRFMKQRKTQSASAATGDRPEKPKADSRATTIPTDARRETSRDAVHGGNDTGDGSNRTRPETGSKYEPATAVDMYGIEASLIGRRSFRGFNAPLERMWAESKALLENREGTGRPRKKISDEELLLRYQESRGVGNLDKKLKRKHRSSG